MQDAASSLPSGPALNEQEAPRSSLSETGDSALPLSPTLEDAYADGRADEAEELKGAAKELRGAMGISQDFSDLPIATLMQRAAARFRRIGESQPPMGGSAWLPIETAPKDQPVLITTTGSDCGMAYWTDEGDGKVWAWCHPDADGGQYLCPNRSPIAWMPRPAAPSCERAAQVAEQLRDLARRQSERGNHSLAETLGEAANLLSPQGKWFISESLACHRPEGCTSSADCASTDTCKG